MPLSTKKILIVSIALTLSFAIQAKDLVVANKMELDKAIKEAVAGDQIIMRKGVWNNVHIIFEGVGTAQQNIKLRAEVPGQTILSGNSTIKIAGSYLVVEGLFFNNGFSKDALIEFRKNEQVLANNCRVTNCAIFNYSPDSTTIETYWIIMWGKQNRFDHCMIGDKLNGGTTLIVNLHDERSRQNFHSIDSNYFYTRTLLGRNGAEIIRIGLSTHSLTNSSTLVKNNYFERCNGEEEVISVKSCFNTITANTFYECQGSLVLRHGNNNIVSENSFIGNKLPNTGGIRVINPNQVVTNNLAIGCLGDDFRSALAVMNGVPNSPLNRYVQVKDSKITNNTFIGCENIYFGVGKDTERTLPPTNVLFANNYLEPSGNTIYKDENKDGGIIFQTNGLSIESTLAGFEKMKTKKVKWHNYNFSIPVNNNIGADLSKVGYVDKDHVGVTWKSFLNASQILH